jgi:hypothetical protein
MLGAPVAVALPYAAFATNLLATDALDVPDPGQEISFVLIITSIFACFVSLVAAAGVACGEKT